jgi:hypothetical protein
MLWLRAILILALLAHPGLAMRNVAPPAMRITDQTPTCCADTCHCGDGCACSMDEPALPGPAPSAPAPVQRAGDTLGVLLTGGGLIAIVSATPPRAIPPHDGDCTPHTSCQSLNALHCTWTT